MKINRVDDIISVAPQILASDLADIAAAGFRTVICNRPDGEGNDQPLFSEIAAAAGAAGLDAIYLPVESGKVTDGDVAAFGRALEAAPRPVLAYCRTGTRSITLWSLSRAGEVPLTEILTRTQAAGYDMSAAVERIARRASDLQAQPAMASADKPIG